MALVKSYSFKKVGCGLSCRLLLELLGSTGLGSTSGSVGRVADS